MPSDSEFSDDTDSICREILGFDRERQSGQAVSTTAEDLKTAIVKAYQIGHNKRFLNQNGVNSEMLFWQLMDSLPDHVYFKDKRSRFICVNRAQARFLGFNEPNDAIGKSDFDFFAEEHARERFDSEQDIIHTGQGWSLHEELDVQADGHRLCILASKLPLRDPDGNIVGTFGISRDITERYQAEKEVERQRTLMDTILQILPCRIFVRDLEERFLMVNNAYVQALGAKSHDELIGRKPSDLYSVQRCEKLLEEDRNIKTSMVGIRNRIEHDQDSDAKSRWIVTSKVPLLGPHGNVEGIVGMTYDITERKRAEEESRRLGRALKRKNEQFEAELLVARQLQETLMSMGFDAHKTFRQSSSKWTFEASYFYKPSHHLAGDFFELIPIGKDKIGILVCDVMGHGVKAALVTMLLRGLLEEMRPYLDQPAIVLENLNRRLCSLAEGQDFPRFVTAAYLVLDLEKGEAATAIAGHPAPIWKVPTGSPKTRFEACPHDTIGPALGLLADETFPSKRFTLDQSTELLFFTDGIIEQKDAMGNEFGMEKLEEILARIQKTSLSTQLSTLESALKLTSGAGEFEDDICIVAVKMLRRKTAAQDKGGA